jgi:hypothetical protein
MDVIDVHLLTTHEKVMTQTQIPPMPMFYRRPTVLSAREHSNLRFINKPNFSFCAKVNSIPVVLSELPHLMPYYPVAFTLGDQPMLMAIVGVRNDENLFVDKNGIWEAGKYIPAYVRRYPYVLMELPEQNFSLAAELDSGFFGFEGERLFENNRPTAHATDVFRFCMDLQKAFVDTQKFCQAVHKNQLLKAKCSTMTTPSGRSFNLSGFAGVDEADINGLDNRTANTWRKQGWLGSLYWHVASLGQLNLFPARMDESLRAMEAAAKASSTVVV